MWRSGPRRFARQTSGGAWEQRGFTLLEILFVLALIALLAGMIVPGLASALERSRGLAAVRYLALRMSVARAQAAARSRNVAIRAEEIAGDLRIAVFVDGNGNGVRAADIESLVDPMVEPPVSVAGLFPGVAISLSAGAASASAAPASRTTLLSFTPAGTATSGSVYVTGRDGTRWAVRVLGATARTRVLRYAPATGEWVPAY